MGPDYLDTASEFLHATRLEDVSQEAREHARWVIADCIPVIGVGMQMPAMRALVEAQLAKAGQGEAWVIGSGRRAAAMDAALLNGTAGVWLELDEGNLHAKGHPGIQVVPAALAVAQDIGASGADLLLAVLLGYEISARISRAAKVRTEIHPHGTYGVLGAAVAVGKLQGFTARQFRELLNISATMGMATSRNTLLEGATVRNIYAGHSGFMGQMAARLTQAGFTGEADGVRSIFGKVLSDSFDPAQVVDGLGRDWLITQGYFKMHCTGRYVHSAIDALEDAQHQAGSLGIDPRRIERIDVRAYRMAAMLSGRHIRSSFGARFSIPFALATLLHHGRSDLSAFSEEAVANPAVQSLAARVFVTEEPSYTEAYPDLQLCDVDIFMDNGARMSGHCKVTRGERTNPHAPSELQAKFFALGRSIWDEPEVQTLYDACMGLERIDDFRAFSAPLSLARSANVLKKNQSQHAEVS
ncbi:MAG: MmgE/PrpD family protein [Burkholderiaceae bacterium]|nr:MmgE/PrpD family protein [Burkholderiaceae bacterium]MDO9090486.1 MmgE/PrpD family protein [Burkholderiaceae bacterium]